MTVTVTVEGPQRWPDCVTYEEHTCICRYVSSRCCHIFFVNYGFVQSCHSRSLNVYCLIVTVTVTMCYQAHAHIHVISPMTR